MTPYAAADFFRSAHDPAEFPPDTGAEIAFAGRSNSGKSSAINALVKRRRLAFVSKTPGRTQCINFFSLGAQRYFVDLPGYGYAAVPAREKRTWEKLISAYLQDRQSLRGLIVVMDSRHPFTPLDRQLLDWMAASGKPAHALLTKADKLTKRAATETLRTATGMAARYPGCSVQLFSASTGIGLRAAQQVIGGWWK